MAEPTSEKFVHLHVHSQYSLLDGACRTSDLPVQTKELGMDSIAISDHGCLFGIVDFYQKCVSTGVKPIIGIEAYMAPGDRRDRTHTGVKDGGYHLLLLAENQTGYRNLLKLASTAYLEGFYYKPRIDREILAAHSQGIVATSACLGGEIPNALTADDRKKAKAIAEDYIGLFGKERFFIELQSHIPEQAQINPELVDLADRLGIGTVATNDVHFLLPGDHEPHDALCCISTGRLISDQSRLIYPKQLYLKSPQEMRNACPELGAKWHEACDNTLRIAEMCDVEVDFSANHAPVVKIESSLFQSPNAGAKNPIPPADFKCDHATGSTEWFKAFCRDFELLPFDSEHDEASEDDLKEACDTALRQLTEAGAIWRYGVDGITPEIRQRMDRELQVLRDKLISAYFLIVWDFVNYARANDIPCNARGSGVGTMVGYCLGLSNACPVKYGLLFELFTDPDRSEYPDIDIDICQDGRAAVIDYVRQKYGHVAQIITFGTLKARAVIRDVARVMDIPLPEVDRIIKMVPDELGITLDKALIAEPNLRKEVDDNPQTRKLIEIGKRLEGLARHASVHAAGVVVATQPLDNIVPLYKDSKSKKSEDGIDEMITQWDGPTCEKVGLLKMDFLGLRTLSIIERAKKLIRQTLDHDTQIKAITGGFGKGPRPDSPREFGLRTGKEKVGDDVNPLDLERLTFVDQNVLDLFRRGDTAGVFQFESGGMRNLLMGMKPDRLEDLIAANALFRPGPMDLIPDYNDRKNGRAQAPKVHPVVDKFTDETYGIMVYQEQVMQILHELGSIPLREAYSIIKAISKKKASVIDKARSSFIEGAGRQQMAEQQAEDLFDLILKFAGYGFNKSHSTGYAIVAYQTAYLKTYFPVQYMAAVLTYESGSIDKVTEYMDECKRVKFPSGGQGIEVRPPDINLSLADFSVVFDEEEQHDPNHGHIRFGLGAVKGVGAKAVDAIVEIRAKDGPFTSLFHFCERVPSTIANKGTIEALIRCGAFDSCHGTPQRGAMLATVERAIRWGSQTQDLNSGGNLFGEVAAAEPETQSAPALESVPAWDNAETLKHEKDVLGFYVSSHPLDRWKKTIRRYTNVSIAEAKTLRADTQVTVGGMLTRVRQTVVKNGRSAGQKMAMFTIEDDTGAIEGVIFSDSFATHQHLLEPERIVFIKGKIDRRREEPNLIADSPRRGQTTPLQVIIPIEEAAEALTEQVRIIIRDQDARGEPRRFNGEFNSLKTMLRQTPGRAPVVLELRTNGNILIMEPQGVSVKPGVQLAEQVDLILRIEGSCELQGPKRLINSSPDTLLREGEETVTNRLRKQASDESCDSIDRY